MTCACVLHRMLAFLRAAVKGEQARALLWLALDKLL